MDQNKDFLSLIKDSEEICHVCNNRKKRTNSQFVTHESLESGCVVQDNEAVKEKTKNCQTSPFNSHAAGNFILFRQLIVILLIFS